MADDITSSILSSYTSGQINFTGLGNGTDFNTLIDGLVKAESYNITRLTSWKQTWTDKMDAFRDLNTKLLALKTSMDSMDTLNEFLTKSVASTDDSLVSATADSSAETGTHKILINQLAQNKVMVGNTSFASADTVVNTASGAGKILQYVYKGTTYQVTVPSGTTLSSLVNLINNQPANPGVRAMAIYDGTGYHLQFRGLDLGADATLTVGAGTTLSGFLASNGWTTTQSNQNSQIRVDGWPTSSWISTDSNTLTGVIQGLTLNLRNADPGTTVTLTTDTDTEKVKDNVREFVKQVNDVLTKIQDLTKYDSVNQQGSILTGNYGIDIIGSKLKDILATKGIGTVAYNTLGIPEDSFSSLGQIGITTDAEEGSATYGLLKLDEEALDEALTRDPDSVAKLLAADGEGESKSSNLTYLSHIDGTTQAGEYRVKVTVNAAGTGIASATINGHPALVSDNWEITGTGNTAESGLAIRLDTHTAGSTFEGTVVIKQGKAGELSDALKQLTSTTDGPLHILEENYTDITESIDKKIAYEEDRLERMKRTLQDKFARLDALLGQYDQINTQLSSAIKQLPSGSS